MLYIFNLGYHINPLLFLIILLSTLHYFTFIYSSETKGILYFNDSF